MMPRSILEKSPKFCPTLARISQWRWTNKSKNLSGQTGGNPISTSQTLSSSCPVENRRFSRLWVKRVNPAPRCKGSQLQRENLSKNQQRRSPQKSQICRKIMQNRTPMRRKETRVWFNFKISLLAGCHPLFMKGETLYSKSITGTRSLNPLVNSSHHWEIAAKKNNLCSKQLSLPRSCSHNE